MSYSDDLTFSDDLPFDADVDGLVSISEGMDCLVFVVSPEVRIFVVGSCK